MYNQESAQDLIEQKPTKITITIPTQAYFLSGIRDFTLQLVKNMTGFSEQWAFRFQSIVDELCNNAIEFGSKAGDDIRIIFISKKQKSIEIYVEDHGNGKHQTTPEEITRIVKENQQNGPLNMKTLRGRGLPHIVANWTDVLEFTTSELGGICAHVVKKLNNNATQHKPTKIFQNNQENIYKI